MPGCAASGSLQQSLTFLQKRCHFEKTQDEVTLPSAGESSKGKACESYLIIYIVFVGVIFVKNQFKKLTDCVHIN